MRGACALRPGLANVSHNIRVRSIVGRFLEHSRIFAFGNGGNTEVYLGSADWMPRNLHERVEVVFRLKDPALCQRVCSEILLPYFADTEKTRILSPSGEYRFERPRGSAKGRPFNVQEFFVEVAKNDRSLNGAWPSRLMARLRTSPVYEILSASWNPSSAAQPDPPDATSERVNPESS